MEYKKGPIKNILLLHNILCSYTDENDSSRFSFSKFKSEKWDVEHIHATADYFDFNGEKNGVAWLEATKAYIKDVNLLSKMTSYNASTFSSVCEKVILYLGDNNNTLGNLCLLDASTNRGYGCAVYADKRSTILEKHNQGKFIPNCTLNVFNKFYSKNVENMVLWDKSAQTDYTNHIAKTIKTFIENE